MGKLTEDEKLRRAVERDHLRIARRELAKAERRKESADHALHIAKRVAESMRDDWLDATRQLRAVEEDQRRRAALAQQGAET
jgi:multidrug resistance efflux pump